MRSSGTPIRHASKCISRACDQCKLRKTKCSLSQPCAACTALGFDCTFLNPQKKRGPAGHRLSQIRKQQSLQANLVSESSSSSSDLAARPPSAHGSNVTDFGLSPTATVANTDPMPPMDIPQYSAQLGQLNPSQVGFLTMPDGSDRGPWTETPNLESWLPDSFSSQIPFGFSGSNIFVRTSLPPIIDPKMNQSGGAMQSENSPEIPMPEVALTSPSYQPVHHFWPSYISETNLIPWIDLWFDRLHTTLPVLNRSSLFIKILRQEHRQNSQFGAMILSLCAFSLTQPIDISERSTSSSRAEQARMMMNEATKMRSSSDFGENPSLDAVLTSFFLFGCLFGSNQHNAARLRLREAVDLAATLGLNDPNTYAELSGEEKGQRLRTYLVLSVTERAYALQRRHSISFTGRPGYAMRPTDDFLHNATHSLVSGIVVHNEKDAAGMMGLALLMEIFDSIDEEILTCWNSRCNASAGKCQILTANRVLDIYQNLARVSNSSRYNSNDWFDPESTNSNITGEENATKTLGSFLTETQCADVLISQKWVQDRLWNLSLSHGLLHLQSEHMELQFSYAFHNAEKTLELCKTLRISAMEAHGIGIIEKLFNIATSAVMTPYNTGNAATDLGISDTSMHVLASQYLKLMETLRGGNHPYTEPYKAQLGSIYQ